MSENKNPTESAPLGDYVSPEEQEAAMAANEADALTQALADLASLKAKSADLADQYLRAKADAENARRRAEEEVSKARKFGVENFKTERKMENSTGRGQLFRQFSIQRAR